MSRWSRSVMRPQIRARPAKGGARRRPSAETPCVMARSTCSSVHLPMPESGWVASVTGTDAVDALISTARLQFRGHALRLLTRVDAHHNTARFSCELTPPGGGYPKMIGFDLLVASDDGRIRAMYGFFDMINRAGRT